MSDPIDPYPGNLRQHKVIQMTAAIGPPGTFDELMARIRLDGLERHRQVMSQRTEILEAFIAKHGAGPDEIEQVVQTLESGDTIYWVRRKDRPVVTNDPAVEYEKAWTGNNPPRLLSVQRMMGELMSAMDVSDHYENLIRSGGLISRAELVEWLEEKLMFTNEAVAAKQDIRHQGVATTLKLILDHLKKKP